jgi:hypothetical protein
MNEPSSVEETPMPDLTRNPMTLTQPAPSPVVQHALNLLITAKTGTEEQKEQLGPTSELGRPWIPASCIPRLRRAVWMWMDDIAPWLNEQYGWRMEKLIPACWPLHPHIANELPVLACQRRTAELALDPHPLEDWHRYTLRCSSTA